MTTKPEAGSTRREALAALGLGAAGLALAGPAAAAGPTFPKGAVIRTILKDYDPNDLAGGATLFHEHMSQPPEFMPKWMAESRAARAVNALPTPPGRAGAAPAPAAPAAGRTGPAPAPAPTGKPFYMQDIELMTAEMKAAKADGIACIVDAGHPDMGRDIKFIKTLSEGSGMPIVAGAGFYSQPFYPKEISTQSETQIFQAIMKQVQTDPVGVFGEIGSWDYISKDERKVFRAIGRAHLATNMPIFTHTGIPGKSALEQLDILEDVGVDPRRVCIGHLGDLVDETVEIHRAICRRGAFVGFDRQGGAGDTRQVPMVIKLLEAGYADNLLFASDFSGEAALKKNNPAAGYAKTLTVFVPKLKAAGANEAVLKQIMNENSRRFLAYVPKIKRAY